jgi:hypothetical protein
MKDGCCYSTDLSVRSFRVKGKRVHGKHMIVDAGMKPFHSRTSTTGTGDTHGDEKRKEVILLRMRLRGRWRKATVVKQRRFVTRLEMLPYPIGKRAHIVGRKTTFQVGALKIKMAG